MLFYEYKIAGLYVEIPPSLRGEFDGAVGVLEGLGALLGVCEGEGLPEMLEGGVGAASAGEAGGEEIEGGEDGAGAHVFVLAALDGVVQACEGGALFLEEVEGVAVAAKGQIVFAGLVLIILH